MSTYKNSDYHPTVSESAEPVTFTRPRPGAEIRPVDYRPYQPLYVDLEKKMDEWLKVLLAGEIDDGNADVLDSLIIDTLHAALLDLSMQSVSHRDVIHDLSRQTVSARQVFEKKLETNRRELARYQEQLNDINERYTKSKWR